MCKTNSSMQTWPIISVPPRKLRVHLCVLSKCLLVQQRALTIGCSEVKSWFNLFFTELCKKKLYLWVEDKVLGCAHVLSIRVRLEVDATGVRSIGATKDRRGNVGTGEIHVRWAVVLCVQPHHVGGVHAEVGRVLVKEGEGARQLRFLVDHLEQFEVMYLE